MATNCSVLGIPEVGHPWGLRCAQGLAPILREVTVPGELTDPHHSLLERELTVLKTWPCPEGAHSPEPGPCPQGTRGALQSPHLLSLEGAWGPKSHELVPGEPRALKHGPVPWEIIVPNSVFPQMQSLALKTQ